jgi:hypothetical protein
MYMIGLGTKAQKAMFIQQMNKCSERAWLVPMERNKSIYLQRREMTYIREFIL